MKLYIEKKFGSTYKCVRNLIQLTFVVLLILVQSISPQHGSKEDNSSKNRFRNPAAQPLPSTEDEVLPGQGSPCKPVTSNAPSPYNASMIPLCILNSNTMGADSARNANMDVISEEQTTYSTTNDYVGMGDEDDYSDEENEESR